MLAVGQNHPNIFQNVGSKKTPMEQSWPTNMPIQHQNALIRRNTLPIQTKTISKVNRQKWLLRNRDTQSHDDVAVCNEGNVLCKNENPIYNFKKIRNSEI